MGCSAKISIDTHDDFQSTIARLEHVLGELGFQETNVDPELRIFHSTPWGYSVIFHKVPKPSLMLEFGAGGIYEFSVEGIKLYQNLTKRLIENLGLASVHADKLNSCDQIILK